MKRSKNCKAYATTTSGELKDGIDVTVGGIHLHPAMESELEVVTAKNALKREAKRSRESTASIVSKVARTVPEESAADLPRMLSLSR